MSPAEAGVLERLAVEAFARRGHGAVRDPDVAAAGDAAFASYRLRGPWPDGAVRLHLGPAEADEDDDAYRLELDVALDVREVGDVIDPDTVLRVTIGFCQDAQQEFLDEHPELAGVLDPDATGIYLREVNLAGLTVTRAVQLHIGCDVLDADPRAGVAQAVALLHAALSAVRRETPFLSDRPGRGERRGSPGRRRR
jgi:hypothetical protein